jgi:hypothetical protein
MKLFGVRQTLLGAALLVAAGCTGCGHEVRTMPAAAPRHANPTPEQKFDTIFDTFRRRIEDTPVGFVVKDSTSRTSMVGTNKVSKELLPPAKEGDPLKAVITVVTESRYSILRTKESSDETANDQSGGNRSNDPLAEKTNDLGEPADPALPSKPTPDVGKSRIATDVIKPPTEQQDIRKYELHYENGRWVLDTKLNTKTEQSIQNAFNNALDTQNSD